MVAIKRLDEEIIALTQDEEVIAAIEEADDYDQSVYEQLVRLDSHLAPSGSANVLHDNQVKLPKLNLPTFSGDVTTWTAFWDSYEAAMPKNTQLPDIERFSYLRYLIKGIAQDMKAGLASTSVTYAVAITLLCEIWE
uniref:Uncharacterized protein n=1 Tax=Amphimedon queenslandica TaxID=400682 RepID=A0A1X7V6K8_AMPQE